MGRISARRANGNEAEKKKGRKRISLREGKKSPVISVQRSAFSIQLLAGCRSSWKYYLTLRDMTKNPKRVKRKEKLKEEMLQRRHRTLKEYTAIVANIVYKEGEITEEKLIDTLEEKGISHWTYDKIKIHIRERLREKYPEIKINKTQTRYWIGHSLDSLSSLSTPEKEDMK